MEEQGGLLRRDAPVEAALTLLFVYLQFCPYLLRLPCCGRASSSTFENPAGTSNLEPSTEDEEKFDISMVISIREAEPLVG